MSGKVVSGKVVSGEVVSGEVVSGGAGERAAAAAGAPTPDELRAQLERILGSPAFEASARRRRFLRYILDETLAGRADRLKGYSIATDVFERDASFDPQTDPVVRLEARRLRRALEHYYLTAGRDDPIRIAIPKGGYAPLCARQAGAVPDSFASPPAGASHPPARPRPAPAKVEQRGSRPASGGLAIAASAFLALAATTGWLWLGRAPSVEHVAEAATALQLEGPAVVIAPFEDLTGTEAGRLFVSGLTQELITNLMRFNDLRVYAVRSSEQLDEALDQRLDVRYAIEGSVRRTADRLHLIVHLIELGSGRYLWSETYDRPLTAADLFAVQEELAAELAGRLAEPYGIVHQVSAELFRRQRPDTLFAYDCVLQAFAYRRTYRRDLYLATRQCLEQAVRDDPGYPAAWAMLAYAHLDEYRWYGWGPLFGQPAALDQALGAAQRALELDPGDVMTLSAYAAVQFYRGAFDEAEAAQRRAVALNPNNPEPLAQLGWRVAVSGDWDQGIALVRAAAARNMAGTGWYHLWLAIDDYRRGDCPAALASLERLGGAFFFLQPALVAMCQAALGHHEAARAALDEAQARDPTFARDPAGAFRLHHLPEPLIDQFLASLRQAGLADHTM